MARHLECLELCPHGECWRCGFCGFCMEDDEVAGSGEGHPPESSEEEKS